MDSVTEAAVWNKTSTIQSLLPTTPPSSCPLARTLARDLLVCRRTFSVAGRVANASVNAMLRKYGTLARRNSDLARSLLSASRAVLRQQAVVSGLAGRVEDLEQRLDDAGRMTEARQSLEKARGRTAALQGQVATLTAELARLSPRIGALEATARQLETERRRLERNVQRAGAENEEMRRRVEAAAKSAEGEASQLLFRVDAGAGLSFRMAFFASALQTQPSGHTALFRSPELSRWSRGRFRRVSLVLRSHDRPVVRLDFAGEHADRLTWFRRENLLTSSPWPVELLRRGAVFSSLTDDPVSLSAHNSSCRLPRLFLALMDRADDCLSLKDVGKPPFFLYSLQPDGSPSDLAPGRRRVADSLEIRGILRSSVVAQLTGQQPALAAWDLVRRHVVFSVTSGSRLSPAKLWAGRLRSLPFALTEAHLLAADWFRSSVLDKWPSVEYRRALVSMVDRRGKILALLEFDAARSTREDWFSQAAVVMAVESARHSSGAAGVSVDGIAGQLLRGRAWLRAATWPF